MRSVSSPGFFFLLFLAAFSFANFASGATLLQDEVKALEDIAKTLGKKDWDFNVDPCSGQRNWTSAVQVKGSENNVTCDCTFANGTVCHVTNILLKSQNLPGTLPRDLFRLPFLQEIDLTRNYLNGTIPKEWGSTKLAIMVLEGNQLSGNLPPELGNLTQIQRLLLSSNNFIGELPVTLVKLTTLQDIVIQGSGLSGPIPSGISFLENLTDLRISDLNGSEHSLFPQLNQMKNLKYLILRNCNINGTLPPYLGNMTTLKNLYLTGNLLNGQVPAWTEKSDNVDISFNNFSVTSQGSTCQIGNVNLFASSMTHNDSGTVACLGSSVCQETLYSLHINCGGKIVTDNGSTYDDDSDTGGPARFHRSGTKNWAYINTDFTPPSKNKSSISVGVVVGVVAAGAVVIILVLGILWWKGCFGKKSSLERVSNSKPNVKFCYAYDWTLKKQKHGDCILAHLLREKGDIMDLVDRRLGLEFNKEEALVMIKVALLCTNVTAALRPTMSSVVSMLEGKIVVDEEFSGETTEVLDEKKMEKMRLYYQELSNSKEEPWTASSTSVADLYPVGLDSSYLEKRD
ncbi:hypothetical protein JHK84_037784 [Glycine max]|nr:hypothetical protein JHK86_037573 [Glycine max]KAG5131387.1 hypothetical protein JHK84_037784 [Glycine max]